MPKARKKTKKEKRAKQNAQPKNMVVNLGDGTYFSRLEYGRGLPRDQATALGRAEAESIMAMVKAYGYRGASTESL